MDKYISTPITENITKELKAGDYVYLSGIIYTARDAAHKRMAEALDHNETLPFDIENAAIYYMGPSPARKGQVIGSAGPTTASRMDKYAPELLDLGQKAMIGKGKRSEEETRLSEIKPFILLQSEERVQSYPNVLRNPKLFAMKIWERKRSESWKWKIFRWSL